MSDAQTERISTLEDARKVLWLRNNHRPLGELLDEGFLDHGRLQWAAEKAYDIKLRQAAQVILNSQTSQKVRIAASVTQVPQPTSPGPLSLKITLEQARSTIWPFSRYKGQPMGRLVETRQLSLRDLSYAIESARDERVRQAAIALDDGQASASGRGTRI